MPKDTLSSPLSNVNLQTVAMHGPSPLTLPPSLSLTSLFACSHVLQDPAETRSRNADLYCKSPLPCYLDQEVPKSQKEAWIFQANLESQEDRIVWIICSQALHFMGAYPNSTLTQFARPSANETPRGTRCAAKAKEPALRWGWAMWGQGRNSREGLLEPGFGEQESCSHPLGQTDSRRRNRT